MGEFVRLVIIVNVLVNNCLKFYNKGIHNTIKGGTLTDNLIEIPISRHSARNGHEWVPLLFHYATPTLARNEREICKDSYVYSIVESLYGRTVNLDVKNSNNFY